MELKRALSGIYMSNCIFCRILSGEFSSSVVWENETIFAFLDIHPISEGHTLVIPKRHVELFTELLPEEVAQVAQSGQLIASHLKKSLPECEGVTFSLANGVAAGQEVPHAHLHVIPRRSGDGFGWKLPPGCGQQVPREGLEAVAQKLRSSINRA